MAQMEKPAVMGCTYMVSNVGVFDCSTGLPLLGVTAQPFWWNVADGKGRWMGRVACGISIAGKTAVHISPPNENATVSSRPGTNEQTHVLHHLDNLLLSTMAYIYPRSYS